VTGQTDPWSVVGDNETVRVGVSVVVLELELLRDREGSMLTVAGIGDAMGAFLDRVVQCENADDDSKKYQLSLFLCLQLAREVDYTLCTTPEWNLVMFACGSQFHYSLRSRVGRPRTVNRGKQISEQKQKVEKGREESSLSEVSPLRRTNSPHKRTGWENTNFRCRPDGETP
jgi:hypothetical protein